MRRGNCQECGSSQSLGSMRAVGDKLLCDTCTGKARAHDKNLQVARIVDPTVCFNCARDNGNAELPVVGGLPYCTPCRELLYNRPFPQWLQMALVGLLVLLVVALVRGAPYWKAGKDLVHGERLVQARQFAQAGDPLRRVLKIAPASEKAILLLAKSDVLSGNPVEASQIIAGHNGGRFKEGPLASEVASLMTRIGRAFQKAEAANKFSKEKKWAEAAQAMREAAVIYPEFPSLGIQAESAEAAVAFEKQDYDGFLAKAEASAKKYSDVSYAAGMLASALACKYAVTGNPAFRQRAEEALARARQLTPAEAQAQAATKEYEERIRYRLDSREIIDLDEYNRRFRKDTKAH